MGVKFKKEYKYYQRYGENMGHMWTVICRYGAKYITIHEYKNSNGIIDFSGGIETLWLSPPDYMKHEAPHHQHCWLLKAPCWHDGSSLYVSEKIIPLFEHQLKSYHGMGTREHNYIFDLLINLITDQWPILGEEK